MAEPAEKLWAIEPHTIAKHIILRKYLGAWFPIMGRYNKKLLYFDGYAGPGEYDDGEPGSPIIALTEALSYLSGVKDMNLKSLKLFLFLLKRMKNGTSI